MCCAVVLLLYDTSPLVAGDSGDITTIPALLGRALRRCFLRIVAGAVVDTVAGAAAQNSDDSKAVSVGSPGPWDLCWVVGGGRFF